MGAGQKIYGRSSVVHACFRIYTFMVHLRLCNPPPLAFSSASAESCPCSWAVRRGKMGNTQSGKCGSECVSQRLRKLEALLSPVDLAGAKKTYQSISSAPSGISSVLARQFHLGDSSLDPRIVEQAFQGVDFKGTFQAGSCCSRKQLLPPLHPSPLCSVPFPHSIATLRAPDPMPWPLPQWMAYLECVTCWKAASDAKLAEWLVAICAVEGRVKPSAVHEAAL